MHSVVNMIQVITTGRPTIREATAEDEAFHLELEQGT
jgi:hypothetical protein